MNYYVATAIGFLTYKKSTQTQDIRKALSFDSFELADKAGQEYTKSQFIGSGQRYYAVLQPAGEVNED